ncbi:hypothetical protein [Neisseria sp. CCUG12390]|uniref:hypothetical protein n=1 Tax=Neisseria sp. CCUG12390 TaxID=3392035 RepID=UPI003A0FD3EF
MGFILLLLFIPVFIIAVYTVTRLLILFSRKQLTPQIIIHGLLLSAVLQILVFCSFLRHETYYAFSPIFRQVLILIILPFAPYIPLEFSKKPRIKKLAHIILFCIFSSIISVGILMFYYDDFLNSFGITSHY